MLSPVLTVLLVPILFILAPTTLLESAWTPTATYNLNAYGI